MNLTAASDADLLLLAAAALVEAMDGMDARDVERLTGLPPAQCDVILSIARELGARNVNLPPIDA